MIALRGARSSDDAFGLLVFSGPRRITPDLEWFASVLAQKLAQVLPQAVDKMTPDGTIPKA